MIELRPNKCNATTTTSLLNGFAKYRQNICNMFILIETEHNCFKDGELNRTCLIILGFTGTP